MVYGLGLSLILLALYAWQDALRYDRSFILQGEYWRLLSAHFVHLNFTHLVMNLVGWWIFLLMCGHLFSLKQISFNIFTLALGISLGLLFVRVDFQWYLGFSGILYGLFLIGSLHIAFREQLALGGLIFNMLIFKLGLDIYTDQASASAQLIGAPVAIVAHVYGLIIGLMLSLPILAKHSSFKRKIKKQK